MNPRAKIAVLIVALAASRCAGQKAHPSQPPVDALSLDAHLKRVTQLCEAGRLRDCVRELDDTVAMAGPSPALLTLRGGAKFRLNDYAGASADFTAAIERDGKDGRVFLLRALSRSLLNPPDQAGACADLAAARKLGVAVGASANGVESWCRGS